MVDCAVSNWTAWSDCSTGCGVGTKSRHRTILTKPRFGGIQCPTNLKETTICNGRKCQRTLIEEEKDIEKGMLYIGLAGCTFSEIGLLCQPVYNRTVFCGGATPHTYQSD